MNGRNNEGKELWLIFTIKDGSVVGVTLPTNYRENATPQQPLLKVLTCCPPRLLPRACENNRNLPPLTGKYPQFLGSTLCIARRPCSRRLSRARHAPPPLCSLSIPARMSPLSIPTTPFSLPTPSSPWPLLATTRGDRAALPPVSLPPERSLLTSHRLDARRPHRQRYHPGRGGWEEEVWSGCVIWTRTLPPSSRCSRSCRSRGGGARRPPSSWTPGDPRIFPPSTRVSHPTQIHETFPVAVSLDVFQGIDCLRAQRKELPEAPAL